MLGFIGLGQMGRAIALKILHQSLEFEGEPLYVYDKDRLASHALAKEGAVIAESIEQLCATCQVLMLCLPTPEVSVAVAKEIASAKLRPKLSLVVEFSTIGPAALATMQSTLSAINCQLIDAPVSGGPLGAKQGTLSLMISGSPFWREKIKQLCLPLSNFEGYAREKVVDIGDKAGLSQLAKLVNNGISMTAFLGSCEVLCTLVALKTDPLFALNYLNSGRARNSGTVTKIPNYIMNRTFNLGASLVSALKDQKLFLAEYEASGLKPAMIQRTNEVWECATKALDPLKDAATLVKYFEQFTGVELSTNFSRCLLEKDEQISLLELADDVLSLVMLLATKEAIAVSKYFGIDPLVQLNLLNAGTARSYWSENNLGLDLSVGEKDFEGDLPEISNILALKEAQIALENFLKLQRDLGMPQALVARANEVIKNATNLCAEDTDVTSLSLIHLGYSSQTTLGVIQ